MTTRLRLLVLASTYPRWAEDPEPGFVHELARRLTRDFEVTVLCPHATGAPGHEVLDGVEVVRYRYAPERLEILVNDGGMVNNLRRRPWSWVLVPGFLLCQMWMVAKLMRSVRPDVIHAHWLIPQGLVVALLAAIGIRTPPFVVTSHGADLYSLRGTVMSALKRFVIRRSATMTVVSEGMLDAVSALGIDESGVRVEPMGVDLRERFRPDETVPRSRNRLLFVGRLVEKKGLRHLLDAMPLILARRPDVTLTVAGFGPEMMERRVQVTRLGLDAHVRFLGAVKQDELPRLYRRAAVFVAPFVQSASGDQDGLGLVLIEALGCGCRVVVSEMPATRRLIADIGAVDGCAAGDEASLAATILRALDAESLNDESDLMPFDWDARADSYATLLGHLAKAA